MKPNSCLNVDPSWPRHHPQYLTWFGEPSPFEVALVVGSIEADEDVPKPQVLGDGTVVTGLLPFLAHRQLGRDKVEVAYWEDPEADSMSTVVRAAMIKDALTTRRIHDLMAADAFRQFWEQSDESMAELAEHCGLEGTLRTWRRWMELLKLPAEVRKALEEGKVTKGQAKLIKDLPDGWKNEVVAALKRGDPIRETLIDCGIVTDDQRLSPHDSACRLLNLFARYLDLWTDNPKGFRSAYVVGRDKLELVRQGIHFLSYVRDELVNDQARRRNDCDTGLD